MPSWFLRLTNKLDQVIAVGQNKDPLKTMIPDSEDNFHQCLLHNPFSCTSVATMNTIKSDNSLLIFSFKSPSTPIEPRVSSPCNFNQELSLSSDIAGFIAWLATSNKWTRLAREDLFVPARQSLGYQDYFHGVGLFTFMYPHVPMEPNGPQCGKD